MAPMFRTVVAIAALPALLTAQLITIPSGTAAVEGNAANAFPWGRGNGGLLIQCVYDSTNFTGQGIGGPIVITGVRWRLDATQARTFTGASYANATIRLSTCPVDQSAVTASFAGNRGTDLQTVYSGPVTLLAGSSTPPGPGPNVVSLSLQTPFYYRPASGDLNVEVELPTTGFTGSVTQLDAKTTNVTASRVYASTTYGASTGVLESSYGTVMQLGYTAVTGLRASFLADITTGMSPLAVQFTDQSYSTATGGITGWAWDFDNDGTVDSTQQHPTHTFTACGVYDVRLTVTDAQNPPHSTVRTAFVSTDAVVPSFTTRLTGLAGTVQFTDTSSPPATSWAWDFDGDTIVDSTLQNPAWGFGVACGPSHPVTLTVHRQCRGPFTTTRDVLAADSIETARNGATTLTGGCYSNLLVTNPQGISVCQMETKTTTGPGSPVSFEVYLTPGTYVGATTAASAWRLVAMASTTGVNSAEGLELATFAPPLYLPPGSYGLYVKVIGANPVGGTQTATQTFTSPDLQLQTGASGTLGGTATTNRVWNGAFHYTTNANNHDAGFSFFGAGCPGPLGIPSLTATSLPRVGLTTSVTFDRLPQSAAFVLMGFNNQTSSLGVLPVDLTVFQAPGCSLRIANDAALFLLGSANAVGWNLGIPAQPGLLGVMYYLQAMALSPGTNGLGGVTSDAAVAIIGI